MDTFKIVLFSSQTFIISLQRYIYREDPASQNDFHVIVIQDLPESLQQDTTSGPGKKGHLIISFFSKTLANHLTRRYQSFLSSYLMKALTIAALFVASVLLIGVTSATSPAYGFLIMDPPSDFWIMFYGFGVQDISLPEHDLTGVIQGSGWGW